ncbi:alkaline phosphatase [bacterium]|nr:alkaline phosphatase [bacterium]
MRIPAVTAALLLLPAAGAGPVLAGISGPAPDAAAAPGSPAVARNIILMIGDGCGFAHLQAGALWRDGADHFPELALLPVQLAVATFAEGGRYDGDAYWTRGPAGQPATDSAAAITALTTGRRTRNGRLATTAAGEPLRTIVAAMERGGRSTGLVTSVQFAHATPAGCAVNGEDRGRYLEIAGDLLTRSPLDVLMGAGHPLFDRQGRPAATANHRFVGGQDVWEGLLAGTAGGDADGDGWPDPWRLLEDPDAVRALAAGTTPSRVLVVARVRETLQQQRAGDRQAPPFAEPPLAGVPTLAEMTRGALNVLDDDPDGFFLMIEGGAIDWASHDRQPGRLIEEVVAFVEAVAAAQDWIAANGGWERNLLLVTSDHETGDLGGPAPSAGPAPGCLAALPLEPRGRGALPGLRFNTGDHTNALVPLLAAGPGSGRLRDEAGASDRVRGPWLENVAIGALLQDIADAPAAR